DDAGDPAPPARAPYRTAGATSDAAGVRACRRTSSASSTKRKRSSRRSSSGTSSTSGSFRRGRITDRIPARCAARTFSLIPPTGNTLPRSVISPVMATSFRTGRRVTSEASAVMMVTPAQVLDQVVGGDPDRLALSFRQPAGHLAGDGGDLPLEVPHARLAGVPPHDLANGFGVEGELVGGEPMGGELLRDQILSRDPDLLLVRVPGQHQDLHPVTQGPGDRVEGVGGGDEQHLRQVEGHPEIIVDEAVVLGGI